MTSHAEPRREPGQSRRAWMTSLAAGGASLACGGGLRAAPAGAKARIAITLDLEMSRNFPTWETTHWDYEKGNLNDETKRYAVEAARRVKARGGVVHFFLVARALEQENIDWLHEIAAAGHKIGNHTYDHVNVLATRPEEIQFRFQRAPWLIADRAPAEVIADNVRLAALAIEQRLGVRPVGFRTPGGFHAGLAERRDIQEMLLAQGYTWVSSRYPAHPTDPQGGPPSAATLAAIVAAQRTAQPLVYESGLVEIPMSPPSDITAFRGGRWALAGFLTALRTVAETAIRERTVFDFLAHPSCLYATDPKFQAIDLLCELVEHAGDAAEIVDLQTVAQSLRA